MVHHLSPTGVTAFVLSNGMMPTNPSSVGEVCKHGHGLTPGRSVGAEMADGNGAPFAEMMARLVAELRSQQDQAARLDAAIPVKLGELGLGRAADD